MIKLLIATLCCACMLAGCETPGREKVAVESMTEEERYRHRQRERITAHLNDAFMFWSNPSTDMDLRLGSDAYGEALLVYDLLKWKLQDDNEAAYVWSVAKFNAQRQYEDDKRAMKRINGMEAKYRQHHKIPY